ncbi:ABC transporter substrate-binding protein [Natrarchaeobaculum aegyptiacum]|uniref:ABC transporter substrate-binding protein n=1 Tax=Natrarchaeobaculum aegyptiacum TaxID=745377 RepID=A0A2Z2HSE1_9EURY|nr:ABC transporter substrate-binding protein [Natrarchaeobaculum aegyptiacum]ARS90090.1 ABC transporter substrate-binding protein [Natrarchaeobaculum aegyptiacum]
MGENSWGTGEQKRLKSTAGGRGGRETRSRRRVLQAAGGAGTLALAGCLEETSLEGLIGSTEAAEGPVTVGVLAPNPDGDFVGRSMARGAEVAVAELNERGGIGGRDVELAVGDTAANPLEARREYHRLVLEEGADVTVGMFDSPALVHVMEDIAEQELLHLTTGAATTVTSQLIREDYESYKYHFRVGPTNEIDLGRGTVDFVDGIAPDVGWESVAVLAEDYDWSDGPWSVLQDDLDETGLDVVLEERYPPATDDFVDLYDPVSEQGADVALVAMAHTGTDALLDWAAPPSGRPYPFAFGGIHVPAQLPSYYDQTNGACRYTFSQISATANSEPGPLTQDFVSAYESEFDENPVYTGYTTYEAVMLYDHVVESAGTFDEDDLVPALEDVSFEGATGTIEFYDRDHEFAHDLQYQGADTLFFQWQENDDGEGVQEVIWPDEHATSEFVSPPWL